jgi:polyphosphate kinase
MPKTKAVGLKKPSKFLNRELSWLEFNQRVLDEAQNPSVPLLERLKFFCISHSNLDEFFEVRVAGLKQELEAGTGERGPDGLTTSQTLRAVQTRARTMVDSAYRLWRGQLVPALAKQGIRFFEVKELPAEDRQWLDSYYRSQVHPVLTPLGIDPAHPFPQLANKTLYLVVQLVIEEEGETKRRFAVVQAPRGIPRLIPLPRDDGSRAYVLVGKMIGHYLSELFPGTQIEGWWSLRVTRNSELYIDEEEVQNLLKAVENELHNRRKGDAVRLELDAHCPMDVQKFLQEQLGLGQADLFLVDGPINATRLMAICEGEHAPELRDPPFFAPISRAVRGRIDMFQAIRENDILLHHPYESYDTVVDFLEQAASDPKVLAIKQTLYRTGGDQRIVGALMNAARNGKQVTAVV